MDWIDEYILGTIEYCNSKDIFEIYNALDIKIVRLKNDNILLQKSEAVYHRNYFGIEVVFIRDDLDYQYEKFILAHELGHAILHAEMLTATFNKDLLNKGKLERQANYFALKLNNIIFDEIELHNMTLEQIASCVGIPHTALKQLANF